MHNWDGAALLPQGNKREAEYYLFDAITKLYNESDLDDARIRELFFAELYKLEEDEFLSFVKCC